MARGDFVKYLETEQLEEQEILRRGGYMQSFFLINDVDVYYRHEAFKTSLASEIAKAACRDQVQWATFYTRAYVMDGSIPFEALRFLSDTVQYEGFQTEEGRHRQITNTGRGVNILGLRVLWGEHPKERYQELAGFGPAYFDFADQPGMSPLLSP